MGPYDQLNAGGGLGMRCLGSSARLIIVNCLSGWRFSSSATFATLLSSAKTMSSGGRVSR